MPGIKQSLFTFGGLLAWVSAAFMWRWTVRPCWGSQGGMAGKEQTPKSGKDGNAREDRLKAALKANLARRKAQAKARDNDKEEQNG